MKEMLVERKGRQRDLSPILITVCLLGISLTKREAFPEKNGAMHRREGSRRQSSIIRRGKN